MKPFMAGQQVRRREERRAGDRGAAAGAYPVVQGADPAQDVPAAAGADRQNAKLLPTGIPQRQIQRQQPHMAVSVRRANRVRQHEQAAGQDTISGAGL
nr:MAG TPA: hypothetical protein [Caudoviricetes sp.]